MAAPNIEFVWIPNDTPSGSINSMNERINFTSASGSVDTTTPLDFGSVNISEGDVSSHVRCFWMRVLSAGWGGNATIENFKFWLQQEGFDQANTKVKYITVQLDPANEWIVNPIPSNYAFGDIPVAVPDTQNVLAGDGSTASISSTSGSEDTTEAIAMYIFVDSSETTGTYEGDDAGYELLFRMQFDYS